MDLGYKNIFTCSMADLFGNWVPGEWIEAVFDVIRAASQWNFLLLTKFPQRLREFEFPENAWPGTSVDLQARVPPAEKAMRDVKATVKWLSIKPLLEPLTIDFGLFNWVVIGGASKSSQTPEWKPPRRWVHDLTSRAMAAGCAVYHKDNLNLDRLRDYPGFAETEAARAPEPFQYLKIAS
jgi:protein gp37